jgi:hypothetical protein
VNASVTLPHEAKSTSTLPAQPAVLVVRKHHFLVRWSHWLNVPILLGLILSGISIYWASPIYQHKPDPTTGNTDVAAILGSGYALMYLDCITTAVRRTGFTTT